MNWVHSTTEIPNFGLLGWLLACAILGSFSIVAVKLVLMALQNTQATLDLVRDHKRRADSWQTFSRDLVDLSKATTTTVAAFNGYDVSVHHFDENDAREARKLLTELRAARGNLERVKTPGGRLQ